MEERLHQSLGYRTPRQIYQGGLWICGHFNTDQGSQFTSDDFTGTLKEHGITISTDGKGRCMDNVCRAAMAQPEVPRRSTSTPMRQWPKPKPALAPGSTSGKGRTVAPAVAGQLRSEPTPKPVGLHLNKRLRLSHGSVHFINPVLDDNVFSGREPIVEKIRHRETGSHIGKRGKRSRSATPIEISAPYATRLLCPDYAGVTPSYAALLQEMIMNVGFFAIGICVAVLARILGHSIVDHTTVFEVATAWMSHLSERMAGGLSLELHESGQPTLLKVVDALRDGKYEPFYGFLNKSGAKIFYLLGVAGWLIAIPLCAKLHRKGIPPVAALGLLMAAAPAPAWFLVFAQHTIVHAHNTGRLLSPVCGLGMSAAVLAGWALAGTHSSRGREKLNLEFT